MSTRQFCTFYLDQLYLGVDVLQVQEVIRFQEMTRIPLAHRMIRGLINLRGQIVTALDLRLRLELPGETSESSFMNVIINTHDAPVSLMVDEIGDVLELGDEQFEPPPQHLNVGLKKMIKGVYKLDDDFLLILNTEKATDLENK
ncbi:MAG: chemotaxis protein CheW [Candidatus Sericytochromatia bacterium]|nr:chemotaxis protein CheW [Candidatus Sericytochromatia bacterium]